MVDRCELVFEPFVNQYPLWLNYGALLTFWLPTERTTEPYNSVYPFNKNDKSINHKCFTDKNINSSTFPIQLNYKEIIGNCDGDKIDKKKSLDAKLEKSKTNYAKKKILTEQTNDNQLSKKILDAYNKEVTHINEYIRAKRVNLILNDFQKQKINEWMNVARIIYNKCVDIYNERRGWINIDYKKFKLEIFALFSNDFLCKCPYAILSYEVKEFCSNVKSCRTQMAQHNITHYELKHKNTQYKQTISIEQKDIRSKGFYPRLMKSPIKHTDPTFNYDNIACDCKLTYDKTTRRYTLFAPQYVKGKSIDNRKKIVALDPGEKTFMSFYGMDHVGMIGEDIRIRILQEEMYIRQSQRKLAKTKRKLEDLKKDTKSLKKAKQKIRQKIRRIKKAIRKYYLKIKHIVNELHNKTAIFLCKNYDNILIPVFKTSEMVLNKAQLMINKKKENKEIINSRAKDREDLKSKLKEYKKKSVLNARVKFVLNMLSHYKFRQQLLAKGEEYGCSVVEVTEEYTSQCCGKCGRLSKNYSRRKKCCPYNDCKFTIDRDYNGSRCIMIKNIEMVLKEPITKRIFKNKKVKGKYPKESCIGVECDPQYDKTAH
jgi:putative transposase